MTLLVPNQGEVLALKALVNHTAGQNLVLRLYKTNVTPAETDTEASYTEATFTGYSAKTLTGSSWVVTGGAPSSAAYAQQTFSSNVDQTVQTIYGYYLTQASSGLLVYAEKFASSQDIRNNGDQILVTPQLTQE